MSIDQTIDTEFYDAVQRAVEQPNVQGKTIKGFFVGHHMPADRWDIFIGELQQALGPDWTLQAIVAPNGGHNHYAAQRQFPTHRVQLIFEAEYFRPPSDPKDTTTSKMQPPLLARIKELGRSH